MLNLIIKFENIVNKGLLWLMERIHKLWLKVCPQKVQTLIHKIQNFFKVIVPGFVKKQLDVVKSAPKEVLAIDFKGLFSSALSEGFKAFHDLRKKSPLKAIWAIVSVPFVFIMNWTKSLHPIHSFLLIGFSVGSVFSAYLIGVNGYKIIYQDFIFRKPASVDESYIRPDYYKKDFKTTSLSSIKIPAIKEGVNGLRSILVDVSFIASNRETKKLLDVNEFPLRDHFIVAIEPVLPDFALTEEGKVMIKEKLEREVNTYLKSHNAPGYIEEVHIIHILAH